MANTPKNVEESASSSSPRPSARIAAPSNEWDPQPTNSTGASDVPTKMRPAAENVIQPNSDSRPLSDTTSTPLVPDRAQTEAANPATLANVHIVSPPSSSRGGIFGSFLGRIFGSHTASEIIMTPVLSAPHLPWKAKFEGQGQYRNGRVERYVNNQRMPPVPMHLPAFGKLFLTHSLNEGDEVKIRGRWKRGQYVKVDLIHNLTTGAIAYRTPSALFYFIVYTFIFWIVLSTICLNTRDGGDRSDRLTLATVLTIISALLATAITYAVRRKHLAKPN